ncbi:MAG: hypothetical protein LRZ84_10540 [Desertifilum sp.]|nr:hypothetical protein [Desertifilum sp.]
MNTNNEIIKSDILSKIPAPHPVEVVAAAEAIAELWKDNPVLARKIELGFRVIANRGGSSNG